MQEAHIQRQTERQKRQSFIHKHTHTNKTQTTKTYRHTGRQADGQTDRQIADRHRRNNT